MGPKIKSQSYKSIDGFTGPIVPNKVQINNEATVRVKPVRHTKLVHVPILAVKAKNMDITDLKPLSLTTTGERPLLTTYTAVDGEQALITKAGIDNFGAIQQYYRQNISNDPIIKEAPTAVVLNATKVSGLAHREAQLLQAKGCNVVGTADASSCSTQLNVFVSPGVSKPTATQYLRTKFQLAAFLDRSSATTQQAHETSQYTADFVIKPGQDRSLSTAP